MRKVRLAALAVLLLFPAASIFAGPGHGGGGSHAGSSGPGRSHGGSSHGSGSRGDGSGGGRSCGSGSHDGGSSHRGGSRGGGSHRGRGRGGVIYGEPYGVGGGRYVGEDFGPGPGYGFVDLEEYDWATVDTDVSPGEARVYLEGRHIGAASDFHGDPDYLYLRPGPYKLEFRLDGYEPLSVNIDAIPDATIAIHQELYRVAGAKQIRPREARAPKSGVLRYWGKYRGSLEAYDSDARQPQSEREADDRDDGKEEVRPRSDTPEEERRPEVPPTAQPLTRRARLSLSIQPPDAAVYLDGRFLGSAEELGGPDGVPLRAGKHRIAVVRPGFKAQELDIEVVAGESKGVDVSLEKLETGY